MGDPSSTGSGGWKPLSVEHLQTLLPQYQVSRLLGHGGMGAVYEGVQSNLDRKVAIKLLPETLNEDEEGLNFAERFKLEARSMANLDHPGIISVYDFGQTSEGQLYFVMEFIDGMDIHHYLQHHGGKVPAEHAIAIIAHVLDALGYAHDQGIVHRDIKPANIMIKSDGRVKVADFGLVKRLSESSDGMDTAAALTMTNMAIGTPDFVAPESLEIGRKVDHRADLYAVGVMFYQLLTGAVPRGNFKPPSGRVDGLDRRLDAVVTRAMEAEPDDRFQSAAEFRAAIDEILSTPVPEEQPTGPVTPSGKRLNLGATGPVDPAAAGAPEAAVERPASSHPRRSPRSAPAAAGEKSRLPLVLGLSIGIPVVIGGVIIGLVIQGRNRDEPETPDPTQGPVVVETPAPSPPTPPAPAPSPTPATEPSPVATPAAIPTIAEPIDLIPLADLELSPEHRREDGALVTAQGALLFDHPIGDEGYLLDMIVTGVGSNGFDMTLPLFGRRIDLACDLAGGDPASPERKIVLGIRGEPQGALISREQRYPDPRFLPGKPRRLVFTVVPGRIRVDIDRETLFEWNGTLEEINWDWAPTVNGEDARGKPMMNFFGEYVIHRLRLLPADATPEPIDLAQFAPKPPAPPEPVPTPDPTPAQAPSSEPEPLPDDPVAKRLAEIDAKYRDAFEASYQEALATLNGQFSGALKREEQAASGTGNLDLVLAFQEEARRIGNGEGAGPPDTADVPPRLKQLRATWHAQHDKLLEAKTANQEKAHAARDQALDLYQQELVKAQDIAAAQRIKSARDAFNANPGAGPAEASEEDGGWITLFDGEALDGWRAVGSPRAFEVVNGAIRGRQERTLLYYEGDSPEAGKFRDFELQAKVKTENAINGGIYFHRNLGEEAQPGSGIEAQIANQNRDARKTGSLLKMADLDKIIVSDGEWFDYGIRSQGNQVTVSINGEVVNEWTRPAGFTGVPEGYFALQCYPAGQNDVGEIWFQDIRVRRLSESPPIAAVPSPPSPPIPPATTNPPPAGGGNPLQPVITEVPELVYPPKRPTRVGELVRIPIDSLDKPEVVASDIVDFRVSTYSHIALALRADGTLALSAGAGGEHLGFVGDFATAAPELKDVVSFELAYESAAQAVALRSDGTVIRWGKGPPLDNPIAPGQERLVRLGIGGGIWGLDKGGRLIPLRLESNHYLESLGDGIVKLEKGSTTTAHYHVGLNDQGRIFVRPPSGISPDERSEFQRIRDAVSIAISPTRAGENTPILVLRDSGELLPFNWPRDLYEDGNPLPPDLPRDIGRLIVAAPEIGPGKANVPVGGILSRSKGWIFFGENVDTAALTAAAEGCFQVHLSDRYFWGLREPHETVAPASPSISSPTAAKLPDFPPARQRIVEAGGPMHLWGTLSGEPIDDSMKREITRELRQKDYTRVGLGGYHDVGLLAIRKNGNGDRILYRAEPQGNEPALQAFEHREILGMNYNPLGFFSEGILFEAADQFPTGGQTHFGVNDTTILARVFNPFLLFGSASDGFQFAGVRVPNNRPFFEAIAAEIGRDRPTLIGGQGNDVYWVTAEGKVRIKRIRDQEGKVEDVPVPKQPPERIVEWAFYGPGVFGQWIARGESGNIYLESRAGFAEPVPELSPARALRAAGVPAQAVALQKLDGSWHAIGLDSELNDFVSKIGPAIDLDIFLRMEQGKLVHRVVTWLEPENALR